MAVIVAVPFVENEEILYPRSEDQRQDEKLLGIFDSDCVVYELRVVIPIISIDYFFVIVTKLLGIIFLHPLYDYVFCLTPNLILHLVGERLTIISSFIFFPRNLGADEDGNFVLSLQLKVWILLDVHLEVVKHRNHFLSAPMVLFAANDRWISFNILILSLHYKRRLRFFVQLL